MFGRARERPPEPAEPAPRVLLDDRRHAPRVGCDGVPPRVSFRVLVAFPENMYCARYFRNSKLLVNDFLKDI